MKKIINCHPGLIPAVRGLDSFKWSIFNFLPIGNTLHFIDKNVDEGQIVFQELTPLYFSDTIETFAERHYNYEIKMLVEFEKYITQTDFTNLGYETGVARKRMPLNLEKEMLGCFEKYKQRYAQG